jgi:hypothetical protein
MSSDRLNLATFEPLLGQTFGVEIPSGSPVTLQLTAVTRARPVQGFEAFSLLFAGPEAVPLAQGTYAFSHDAIGTHPIFIVPVARDANGLVYEAVFS